MPGSGGSVSDAPIEKTVDGQHHQLAYITPVEAQSLVDQGGKPTMTNEGIMAYPGHHGQSGESMGVSQGSSSNSGSGGDGPPGGGDPGMTYTAPVTTGGPPGGGDPKMFYNPDYDEDPGTKVTTIPEEKSLYDKFRDRSYQFGINRHFVNALKNMGAFGKPGFRGFAN